MTLTSADIYLLKAMDLFHYDVEQTVEALSIAYGYDEEHAGVLCLYGRLYYEYLQDYNEAERYFEMALFYDPSYVATYQHYVRLLIYLEKYDKADTIIEAALKHQGVNRPVLMYQRGVIAESKGAFAQAIERMDVAANKAVNNELFDFIITEIKRVKRKMPKEDQQEANEEKNEKKSSFFKLRK